MSFRQILNRLPALTIRNSTGPFKSPEDLTKMVMTLSDTRMRPYIVPRRVFDLYPRYGRRYEADIFSDMECIFDRATRVMRPEIMLRDLEELARFTTVFDDVPLKIKQGPSKVRKSISADSRDDDSGTESELGDQKNFMVQVPAAEFKPEEIAVKIKDGYVTVEAEKEEKDVENGSYKYQQIRRRFLLPSNIDPDNINCEMTKDGYLKIQAEWTEPPQLEKAKRIPIKMAAEAGKEPEESSQEKLEESAENNKTNST